MISSRTVQALSGCRAGSCSRCCLCSLQYAQGEQDGLIRFISSLMLWLTQVYSSHAISISAGCLLYFFSLFPFYIIFSGCYFWGGVAVIESTDFFLNDD